MLGNLHPPGVHQIEGEAQLAGVEHTKRAAPVVPGVEWCRVVIAVRTECPEDFGMGTALYLEYLSAVGGHHPADERPRDDYGEVQDLHSFKQSLSHAHLL